MIIMDIKDRNQPSEDATWLKYTLLCKTKFEIFSGTSGDESWQFQMKNIYRNNFHIAFERRSILYFEENYK